MKVYRVGFAEGYQYLLLVKDPLGWDPTFSFHGDWKADWPVPEVFSYEPLLIAGDFWDFRLTASALVTPPSATQQLARFLAQAGQGLPLRCADERFTLWNVTVCVDCLDAERTVWTGAPDTGSLRRIARYAFDPARLPASSLFKIPQERCVDIFCIEGRGAPEDEFKPFVERHGLTGLAFDLIWDSEVP